MASDLLAKTFEQSGDWQRWNVPDKVEWVEVELYGAGSNNSRGGTVSGRINVKGRKSLHILVGEAGTLNGGNTVGGGGRAGRGQGNAHGWSGGGATIIRANSRTGAIKAVAGGAGGDSGDGGVGGAGGADIGGAGFLGNAGTGSVGVATGGTQVQGGNGGQSSLGDDLAGGNAGDSSLARAGLGGQTSRTNTYGGGGGGGGYRGGGGGAAGITAELGAPGGGGGGGSNFIGGLTHWTSRQGNGSKGDGRVNLTWVRPPPANQPPAPPSEVKIDGEDYSDDMATMAKNHVIVTAKVSDPNSKRVRMIVQYAPNQTFRQHQTVVSDFVDRGKRARVRLNGLTQDTLWHARLYTKDADGVRSINYTTIRFWTNRAPSSPDLLTPGDNASITDLETVLFQWNHLDPDYAQNAHQRGFRFQYRRAGSAIQSPGQWQMFTFTTPDEAFTLAPGELKANNHYEWRVKTQDEQERWGQWSQIRSVFVTGTTTPPRAIFPINDEAIDGEEVTFIWTFRDPNQGATQQKADLRYRAVGATDWTTVFGDSVTPGSQQEWVIRDLLPSQYEWQVRTVSTFSTVLSAWSDLESFFLVHTPGTAVTPVEPPITVDSRLGCGMNEVHIYRRGGKVYLGKIAPLQRVIWGRKRDDISTCVVNTNGFGPDCGALLAQLECWVHEIVVFRDGERVWEGPITRLTDTPTSFEIEAKDPMAYVYRRIMRQGYNDAFRVVNNVQMGVRSVVERARQIVLNALAPDDPNVLPYLSSLHYPDDALQSRSVPDFAKTAWEEIDSLAATAGLDYTTVGRRILLWDTHRFIGRLPELRSKDFSTPPVVTQYGMLLATDFAVTNNNGVYGLATRRPHLEVEPYGIVEQLASAYGEVEGGGEEETMDSEAQANLERILTEQAERNIANRYPTPKVVRVPDNSALSPEAPVQINHLIPGVWVPVRATGTVLEIAQWQKLDSVTVTQEHTGEKVTVVFSPAPNAGQDPDAEVVEE